MYLDDMDDIAAEMGLKICWLPNGGTCGINEDCECCERAIEYENSINNYLDWENLTL